jgi:hypothetical protein
MATLEKICHPPNDLVGLPDELFRFILAPFSDGEPDISEETLAVGIVSRGFLNCIERTRNKAVCKAFRDSVEGGIRDAHLWWISHLKGPAARHSACRGFDRIGRVTCPRLLDPAKSIKVADKSARKTIYAREVDLPSLTPLNRPYPSNEKHPFLCAFTGSERPAVLLAFGLIPLDFFSRLPSAIHASLFLSEHALTALERVVPAGLFDESCFDSFVNNDPPNQQLCPAQQALSRVLWTLYDEGLLHEKEKAVAAEAAAAPPSPDTPTAMTAVEANPAANSAAAMAAAASAAITAAAAQLPRNSSDAFAPYPSQRRPLLPLQLNLAPTQTWRGSCAPEIWQADQNLSPRKPSPTKLLLIPTPGLAGQEDAARWGALFHSSRPGRSL